MLRTAPRIAEAVGIDGLDGISSPWLTMVLLREPGWGPGIDFRKALLSTPGALLASRHPQRAEVTGA
ncbi:MAG: hypothetical protein CL878_04905 [Dehalococcoidia bacterium]|nr:hypothetical protein [Dehalococcoidia bacterium]